jgi:predicted nucleic acid-binding protein
MNDKFFLDTNIFVYSFDNETPKKRDKARTLIEEALSSQKGIISFQVVQVFLNVATARFKNPLSMPDAQEYLEEILLPLCEIFPSNDFYGNALEIRERTHYSFYDSMILQAAREGECRTLYSEDLKDGFKFFDLTIRNPFK